MVSKELQNSFMIDLTSRRVFCTSCRKCCKSLLLSSFTLFWCGTRHCENSGEVRLYRDCTWEVRAFTEVLTQNMVSEITSETLMSITPHCHTPET